MVGLLRLAIRLMSREGMATQVGIIRGELTLAAASYPITHELGSNHHRNQSPQHLIEQRLQTSMQSLAQGNNVP